MVWWNRYKQLSLIDVQGIKHELLLKYRLSSSLHALLNPKINQIDLKNLTDGDFKLIFNKRHPRESDFQEIAQNQPKQ